MNFDFGEIKTHSDLFKDVVQMGMANACMSVAPTSEDYHQSMYKYWGGIASALYVVLPTTLVVLGILIFVSEIHFLQRNARRKRVRYTLYWILGTYPMGMSCHLIALYIPRSVIYMEFAVDVWVAYAISKLFSLVLMMHGGRRRFTQECFEAKSNAIPCCCLMCLPAVHNNVHWAKFMKWGIIQFCFMNVIIGFISIILYCDVKWREVPQTGVTHVTPDNYFSLLRLISTLICIYSANMFKSFQQSKILEGEFDNKHKINWKFTSVLLIVFITGIQRLVFSAMSSAQLLKCIPPWNWERNMKIIESMVILVEFFLLCVFAKIAFTRTDDIALIHKHKNLPIEESDEEDEANAQAENLTNPTYNYYQNQPIISPEVTI